MPGVIAVAIGLGGCLGGDDGAAGRVDARSPAPLPSEHRLARLGLVLGPPASLIRACRRVARETPLTVYCPPVVPEGKLEAPRRRHENAYVFGDEHGYGLSLESESLIEPERDPLAAKHWVVAATAPAGKLVETVDESVAYPRAKFASTPRDFTVEGVEATLVTGDVAGSGFAGDGHAIVYWQIGDTFYQASVHFNDKARVAKLTARGLILQMVRCDPASAAPGPRLCDWVFPGRG